MARQHVFQRTARKGQKIAALVAFGMILVSGAGVASLAAWTDTEWVRGGVGTDPGISTSVFQVQQNVTTETTGWEDRPTSPGGIIAFVDASGLTPGDTAYGFVRLRTVTNSLPGSITMTAATHAAGDNLYTALRYGAGFVTSPAQCASGTFGGAGTDNLVAFDSTLATSASAPFTIAGNQATERIICFAVTLPAGSSSTLQGLSTTPEWTFTAQSTN